MRSNVWALVMLIGLGLGSIRTLGQTPAQSQPASVANPSGTETGMTAAKPPLTAGPLKITFEDKSAEWTSTTLAALPHKTITVYNEHAKATQTYSGVELIDLLKPLGVPEKPHGKQFRLYLVAEGSDGYQVVYSIGEVTPDVHDGTAMVADTMDGKSIAGDGPLKLVATGEKRPARWVRNLVAVRVLTAP